jgi:hypothetical protein
MLELKTEGNSIQKGTDINKKCRQVALPAINIFIKNERQNRY